MLHKRHNELVDQIVKQRKKNFSLTSIGHRLRMAGNDQHVVNVALHDHIDALRQKKNPYRVLIEKALLDKEHLFFVIEKKIADDFHQIQDAIYALAADHKSALYDYLVHVRMHFYFQLATTFILLIMAGFFSSLFWIPLLIVFIEMFILNTHFKERNFHKIDWYPFRHLKIYMGTLFYEQIGATSKRKNYFIGPAGILLFFLCGMGVYFGYHQYLFLGLLTIFIGFLSYVSFSDHIF